MPETKRLLLRNFENADAEILFRFRNDTRCNLYQRYEDTSVEYLREFVRRYAHSCFLSKEEEQHYAIVRRADRETVGDLSVFYSERDDCFTLGITVAPQFQRQGQPNWARTNKVFDGKYLYIHRQKSLQYPHIASAFSLVYPKYLLAKNCRHPSSNPFLMDFGEVRRGKVRTFQGEPRRKARKWIAEGLVGSSPVRLPVPACAIKIPLTHSGFSRKVCDAQQWDCWVIWQFYFQFFKEFPHCSPQWLYQFAFPPTEQEYSLFSTPSPAFIVCRLLDSSHSDQCEMVPHCGFDLHFSDNE